MRLSGHRRARQLVHTATALLALGVLSPATAQSDNTTTTSTKRGLSWIGTSNSDRDNGIFATSKSPLTWYKTWGAQPLGDAGDLEFVPMIHSLSNLDGDISAIRSLGDDVEYVLTFNEPDGDTSGGGTEISPDDAAEAWEDIVKELRDGRGLKISLPATTGSDNGWEWMEEFNESCWERYEDTGCEFDFVAAHWYGAFEGLAGWLGRLREAYPEKEVWVTEYALPQPATQEEVVAYMEQSLGWLDETDWVARYAWFGAFREDDANDWTGDVVSLFDDDGGLTELGSLYMGGEANGFEVGDGDGDGDEGAATVVKAGWFAPALVALACVGLLI